MDNRITDATNEARDNVKYLYSLEKQCVPLYRLEPSKMTVHIPKLMHTIHMIYTTSRYYNTTERITILLSKVAKSALVLQFISGNQLVKRHRYPCAYAPHHDDIWGVKVKL
jgi:hypothetical protein